MSKIQLKKPITSTKTINNFKNIHQIVYEHGKIVDVNDNFEFSLDELSKFYAKQCNKDSTKHQIKGEFLNLITNDHNMVYIEYNNKTIVRGICCFEVFEDIKTIGFGSLYVDEQFRGKGIAKQFIEFGELIGKAFRCETIFCKVDKSNTYAKELYEKYGFEVFSGDKSKESFWFISLETYNNGKSTTKKYTYNNRKEVSGRRRFKCLDCGQRFFEFKDLVKHASKYHKDLVGDEDIYKYLYEKRNPGPYICPICNKNPRPWDSEKRKYKRICDSPECAKKSREIFKKNMKKVYGTDNLLTDPEHQAKMMANRNISGKFKFSDGVEITYVGKYELDFLRYITERYKFDSTDIIECPRELYIEYYDIYTEKKRWYIPDFFMPKFNLVIEIKDGSKYPKDSKQKSLLKDKAVIKEDRFNYIKIVDKNYDDFDNFINMITENHFSEAKRDDKHIFMIPAQKFDF